MVLPSGLLRRIAPITALPCVPGMPLPHVRRWSALALAPAIGLLQYAPEARVGTGLQPCALPAPARAITHQLPGVVRTMAATAALASADIKNSQACPLLGGLFLYFFALFLPKSPKSEFYHLS